MASWLRSLSRLSRSSPPLSSLSPYRVALSTSASASASAAASGLGPTSPAKEKPRVVVLGTGWAGCRLMKGIDTDLYDVVCISPRNHMVFTPLLASTCVGTLEFRSVAEPIGRIQPAVSKSAGSFFFLAKCASVDPDTHTVSECF